LLLRQVSPPLVAFKESVLSGGEAHEGVVIKPAKVVEAATPSGCCVVRVKAHALPNATAALLDEHAHLLRELVEHHGSRQQQQQLQQGKQAAAAAASWRHQRRSIDGNDGSREVSKFREAYDSSLETATNKQLPRLLERAWLLGPRNVGPNVALCSPSACSSSSSNSSTSSLFDVPAAQVVKTSSKHNPAAAKSAATGSIPDAKHQHEQQHSSTVNGVASSHEHMGSAAQDAAADAAEAAHQLDVPFGRPSAAAMLARQAAAGWDSQQPPDSSKGCAAAAAAAAAAGLSELWPHITSSVESGATAGFQLAAGAGPLCDEAMWGVVFELEVRLLLPGTAAAAAAGGGSVGELDLAEAVYGPFSGQVREVQDDRLHGVLRGGVVARGSCIGWTRRGGCTWGVDAAWMLPHVISSTGNCSSAFCRMPLSRLGGHCLLHW
jgi:ribosome assembly protein 1